ncbi:MAG: ABC transporter ATP-binding protein [Akkermansiaceae bacterium]|nr:ABC transporter ATP-binding protein [Akkermansiaceae bacterium]MCP5542984.1 ABC transporter ATP-binding protein [Akkermansiaceae bacterium]MCP5547724.1 ABC transporter ATP-binding protein [Akkermansiaceae bacterium]
MNDETNDRVAVDVRGVEKHFSDGARSIHVMKQVTLQALKGEILMLVGPSGCGKTTLLSAIAGTLNIESGEIDVMGNPVHKMSDAALTRFRAKTIGFIFQQFHLIPTISVAENVGIPLLIQNAPKKQVIDRARAVLDAVGLGDRWKERPNRLSGGQQQRVAIARALVHEPPLVICDEPTAALDARNGEIVLELFRNVARSPDRAVLIVTHDNRIFSYADRVARMDDGEIVEVREQGHTEPPHFVHEHA